MFAQNFNLDNYKDWQEMLFLSGSVFIAEGLSAPLETAKVRLQAQKPTPMRSFLHRRELMTIARNVSQKEGWKGLYKGFKPSMDHQMFLQTTRFYIYYMSMNHIFKNKKHEFRYPDVIGSTILGTTVGTFFSQSSDVTRLRIQSEIGMEKEKQRMDPRVKMRKVLQYRKNTGSLLPGVGVNLLIQNMQALTEVLAFFSLRNTLIQKNFFESNYINNAIAVLAATGLGTLISAPLDLVYTQTVFKALNAKEPSATKCFTELLNQEGLRGMYKSYLPYFFRATVFNLTMVTLLELFCSSFKPEPVIENADGSISSISKVSWDDVTDFFDFDKKSSRRR